MERPVDVRKHQRRVVAWIVPIGLVVLRAIGAARKVIVLENARLYRLPHQPDGQHPTLEGYRMLAALRLQEVTSLREQ
jgi:hypothetical protein